MVDIKSVCPFCGGKLIKRLVLDLIRVPKAIRKRYICESCESICFQTV